MDQHSALASFLNSIDTGAQKDHLPEVLWVLTLGHAVSAHKTKCSARTRLADYLIEREISDFDCTSFVLDDDCYGRIMGDLPPSEPYISIQRVKVEC